MAVQCKHPVETGEVNSWLRHQSRQTGDEAFTVKNALLSLRLRRQKYSGLAEVPESPQLWGFLFITLRSRRRNVSFAGLSTKAPHQRGFILPVVASNLEVTTPRFHCHPRPSGDLGAANALLFAG